MLEIFPDRQSMENWLKSREQVSINTAMNVSQPDDQSLDPMRVLITRVNNF